MFAAVLSASTAAAMIAAIVAPSAALGAGSQPTITSFTPADGAATTTVTITGTNFVPGPVTAVKFGTFADTTFTVDSPTQITAHVPSGFSTGKISVVALAGAAVSTGTFSVPKITGVSPAGAVAGSTVTITGQGLGSTSTVDFQGSTGVVPSVTPTATTVRVLVPGDAHVGPLVAHTANASPVSSAASFKPLPKITSISPADGTASTDVTITGTNLVDVSFTKFGSTVSSSGFGVSATELHATPPGAPFSSGTVSVTTAAGTATSTQTFAISKVMSFSPASAVAGSTVTISGQGLGSTTSVHFDGHSGVVPTVGTPTATAVKVLVPSDATVGQLAVNTGNAGPLATLTAFKPLPRITSISPADGVAGTDVTITGTNLLGVSAVKFGAVAAASFATSTATSEHATVPGGAFSSGTVTVVTPGGTGVSTQPFEISKVTSFSPASAAAGATVTITGQGLGSATSVEFPGHVGGVSPVGTPTATAVQVLVPSDATVGALTVNTGNAGPLPTATAFKPLPTITSISPADGTAGTDITITGTNLLGVSAVKFGSVAAGSFGTSTATSEHATVPGGAFSSGTVTVVTPGGTGVSTQSFAISRVVSFSPASAVAGATVTITGQGLGSVTAVDFPNHSGVAPAPGSTATQLKVIVPNDATIGQLTVYPGHAAPITTAASFKALPSIASFSPGGELAGATVTITGANFNNLSSIKFGTIVASDAYVDATHVTALVPSGFTSGKITVTTANGSAVSAGTFYVTKPASMTPTAGPTSAGVTIHGVGLDSVTFVTFTGGGLVAAQDVTPTSFDTTVPTGALTGPLTLHTASGGTIATTFSYTVNFAATGFSPSAAAYGSVITISGVGLTGVTEVYFYGVGDGTSITAQTGTSLQVTVPASGGIDGVPIVVYKGGTGVFMNTTFKLFAADSGAQAAPAGGTFAITGTGLDTATGVSISGESASFTHDNDNQLTITVPNDAASGAISVVGPGGTLDAGSFTLQIAHSNGLDINSGYFDSAPLGTPGNASTYSYTMGDEARNSWSQEPNAIATGLLMCGSASYNAAYMETDTEAAVWVYGGSLAGYVNLNTANNTPTCPTFTDPNWN